MRVLFALALFTSATLVFWVEPLVARLVLPLLGGAPSVWATSLAFFQALLLAGYLGAHLLATHFSVRAQAITFTGLVLLAATRLPVSLAGTDAPVGGEPPAAWLLVTLVAAVGAPFLVLSMTSPLLQRWFSHATGGRDPYWLNVAGNAGSLGALVAFPLLLEPSLAVRTQAWAWAGAYGAFALLVVVCAAAAWRRGLAGKTSRMDDADAAPTWSRRARWVAWSALPSMLLTGATGWVSTDVSSVPLLWVVPLALYLSTFMLAFGAAKGAMLAAWSRVAIGLVVVVLVTIAGRWREPAWAVTALHFGALFAVSRALHGALATDRPPVAGLTGFFAWVSFGGALGGSLAGLVSPLVFDTLAEYPLALVAVLALVPAEAWPRSMRIATVSAAAAAVGIALVFPADPNLAHVERSFFGVHRVLSEEGGEWRWLRHGLTMHGLQHRVDDPGERRRPMLYYAPDGPVGDVFAALAARGVPVRAGIVGLGVGAIASHARPGDRFTFFEIDPVVVRLATEGEHFTFLREMQGDAEIVLGDARLSLAARPDTFDVLVVDAFSSDAVPVHLLTREAIRDAYLPRLAPGGILVLHLSNRFLDLTRVAAAGAVDAGLAWRVRDDVGDLEEPWRRTASVWMSLARHEGTLAALDAREGWTGEGIVPIRTAWTDDFSNVLEVFRWRVPTRGGDAPRPPAAASVP